MHPVSTIHTGFHTSQSLLSRKQSNLNHPTTTGEPCRKYTETPMKTLDGLYVTQPKRFLPLAQEAKKLAKELCKEEIVSQWAGLLPRTTGCPTSP